MLDRQLSMNFSQLEGLYDMVVPKDHLLRKINDLVDFSLVYEELESKYWPTTVEMPFTPFGCLNTFYKDHLLDVGRRLSGTH